MAGQSDAIDPRSTDLEADSAAAVLARHGRSFHWSSRLLSPEHARDAAILYAFCRHADDLVDERAPVEGAAAIEALRTRMERLRVAGATAPRPGRHDPLAAFVALAERRRLDPAVVDVLLDTLRQDAGPVRLRSLGELLRYAFGVASTVGLMLCVVLGCVDRRARASSSTSRAFAIDLGVAMQLTNVARDVLEDAQRGRIYLPLPADLRPEHLLAGPGPARDRALVAVHEVLDLSARYYRSADRGLCYLPGRARAAILAASRIYEGIGAVIRRRGVDYWSARCHVRTVGKIRHTLRAAACLLLLPRYWRLARGAAHDPTLHAELAGLPAVASP
jgi:phytoene synthase